MEYYVNVIGAGLAGVEASYQLAKRNIKVRLYEMRPAKKTPAHQSDYYGELVCSNSLRGDNLVNAVGVLKREMEMLDSIIIKTARKHAVPAGGALAVDREGFGRELTDIINNHENIEVIHQEVTTIPEGLTIIASGPLTSEPLAKAISEKIGSDYFYFFDAAAPIIEKDSVDFTKAYFKSRYDKGDGEYINCPMTKEEFENFYNELINAQVVKPKDFEEKFFEGCMPFEEIARRGEQTLLFGPMKPVGLNTPEGIRPYAVVQLRQDNAQASLYNIVGFQTHLTWPEQKRIIQMIPGLENAHIVRYGVMHRNSYICSPVHLEQTYRLKNDDQVYLAGQITGVEGYVESAQSGLVAALNVYNQINDLEPVVFPQETVMGALSYYITNASATDFQPMKANFGIIKDLEVRVKKKMRKEAYGLRALEVMEQFVKDHGLD